MQRPSLLCVSVSSLLVLSLMTSLPAKKLRAKFGDCFITGIDENGAESADLGALGPGKAVEDVEAGEIEMKCRAKVQNLSGEKQEITGGVCSVVFISDGAEAETDDNVQKVSKSGKAKLFCRATRDDVVP